MYIDSYIYRLRERPRQVNKILRYLGSDEQIEDVVLKEMSMQTRV